ncbi:hypothetical protein MPSEU_000143500 [Mayamaea pseudoterrestris]|nr:hypothetical protein MPSEU_000143500 [Mayamaea pseudoterrestris]
MADAKRTKVDDEQLLTDEHWEHLNYYQLLGLDSNDQNIIDEMRIKKAYRTQAKLYHPDKIAQTNNATSQNVNSRFAKIAEAYQVLMDPTKRRNYDQHLRQEEWRRQFKSHGATAASDTESKSWFNSFDDSLDPFAIFDMVFGTNTASSSFASSVASAFESFRTDAAHDQKASIPVRTTQEQHEFVDALGRVLTRMRRVEEYSDSSRRVLEQDFVQEWDSYARQWVLVPLQPHPVIVEERKHAGRAAKEANEQSRSRKSHQSSSQAQSEWLWPGTILRPGMYLTNGHYQAGLTPTCELVVTRTLPEQNDEDEIVWSSGASMTGNGRRHDCGWWLEGRRILVAAKINSSPQVVWHSNPANDDDDDDSVFMYNSWARRVMLRVSMMMEACLFINWRTLTTFGLMSSA